MDWKLHSMDFDNFTVTFSVLLISFHFISVYSVEINQSSTRKGKCNIVYLFGHVIESALIHLSLTTSAIFLSLEK